MKLAKILRFQKGPWDSCGFCDLSVDPEIDTWGLSFQGKSWDSCVGPRISGVDPKISV